MLLNNLREFINFYLSGTKYFPLYQLTEATRIFAKIPTDYYYYNDPKYPLQGTYYFTYTQSKENHFMSDDDVVLCINFEQMKELIFYIKDYCPVEEKASKPFNFSMKPTFNYYVAVLRWINRSLDMSLTKLTDIYHKLQHSLDNIIVQKRVKRYRRNSFDKQSLSMTASEFLLYNKKDICMVHWTIHEDSSSHSPLTHNRKQYVISGYLLNQQSWTTHPIRSFEIKYNELYHWYIDVVDSYHIHYSLPITETVSEQETFHFPSDTQQSSELSELPKSKPIILHDWEFCGKFKLHTSRYYLQGCINDTYHLLCWIPKSGYITSISFVRGKEIDYMVVTTNTSGSYKLYYNNHNKDDEDDVSISIRKIKM